MKALKLLFLLAGLIFTLLMVKRSLIPYSCEIVFSNLVGFWNSSRCFLSSSLYICIIINSMVLLIAATSTSLRHENTHGYDIKSTVVEDHDILASPPPLPPPLSLPRDVTGITPHPHVTEVEPPETLSRNEKCSASTFYQVDDHDKYTHFLHSSTAQSCVEKTNLSSPDEALMSEAHDIKRTAYSLIEGEMVTINPPPYRKENGLSMEMGAEATNNQSDEKENEEDDTMEATWKAITEVKTKQLQKSETWTPRSSGAVQSLHSEESPSSTTSWKDLRKSETFNEAASIRRGDGLRRDPSVGIDEFNQQIEAFIKKFNDEMRLQRQQSDQRFLDMIKR